MKPADPARPVAPVDPARPAPAVRPTPGALSFRVIEVGARQGNFAAVAAGDIDGDGYAELVSGHIDGQQGLALFRFDGSAWHRLDLTTRGEYGGVVIADITGEGRPDVVAVKTDGKRSGDGVELITFKGKGATLAVESKRSPYADKASCDVAVGDIEGDGDLDIACSTRGDGVKVLINEGEGQSFRVIALEKKVYEDTGIAMGDANGDGLLDVISTNHPGENPHLFLCTGKDPVAFDSGHNQGLRVGPGIGFGLLFAHVNDDEHLDLVIGTQSGLKVFRGNGCKGDDGDWWRSAGAGGLRWRCIHGTAGDVDLDGKLDLVFGTESGVVLLRGDGRGAWGRLEGTALPRGGEYSSATLFDWDNDGDLDIAVSSLQGNGVRLYENRAIVR